MIKKLGLLILCTLAVSQNTQAMFAYLAGYPHLAKARYSDGPFALHYACSTGDLKEVSRLLATGADVNRTDNDGWTPLHYAAALGHKEIVALLIEYGARVDNKNNTGETPLHRAADNGYTEIVDLLLIHNASIDSKDENGVTPLRRAYYKNHGDIIKLLVSKSFFPPSQSLPAPTAQSDLQERCLIVLLKNFNKAPNTKQLISYIASHPDFSPEDTANAEAMAEHVPLELQQALIAHWKQLALNEKIKEAATNKQNLLIKAHAARHLTKIKNVLKTHMSDILVVYDYYETWLSTNLDIRKFFIRSFFNENPGRRDVAEERRQGVIEFVNQLYHLQDFDHLPEELQQSILTTIQEKLLLEPAKS